MEGSTSRRVSCERGGGEVKSEEMRVAVAEVCRWKQDDAATSQHQSDTPVRLWRGPSGELWGQGHSPPDYPNDLNAMHEAEKTLANEQADEYGTLLNSMFDHNSERTIDYCDWHATSLRRCEAFLRVHGRYQETPNPQSDKYE